MIAENTWITLAKRIGGSIDWLKSKNMTALQTHGGHINHDTTACDISALTAPLANPWKPSLTP